jgi:glycosyltransferase involved in cell wall biosynthesis
MSETAEITPPTPAPERRPGPPPPERRSAPRVLYVVSEDWYFLSHRLPMARAAREAGFEVHVATKVTNGGQEIEQEGFILHPIPFARGKLAPFTSLRTILALLRIHRAVDPEIVHHVALQPSVLGTLAAGKRSVARVNALTGLGYTFTSNEPKARLFRRGSAAVLRYLFDRSGSVVLVQNPDDAAALLALGIPQKRIVLIPGSGVEVDELQPLPDPTGTPTVGFVGRLLEDKGIRTLVEAHLLLRLNGVQVELRVAGSPDPANPASVTEEEAEGWVHEPGIAWEGHVEDIAGFWSKAHVAVLPSRREGLPKSLLEAAACGRPLIASDVPGCREIVKQNETGLLVPVDNAPALADAIQQLISSPRQRARFGAAARKLVVEQFAAGNIGRMTVELYRRLVSARERAQSSAR